MNADSFVSHIRFSLALSIFIGIFSFGLYAGESGFDFNPEPEPWAPGGDWENTGQYEDAVEEMEFVPVSDNTPYTHPTVIEQTALGHFLVAWAGGSGEGQGDTKQWACILYQDGTWGEPFILDEPVFDGEHWQSWDPVIFQPTHPGSPLIAYYRMKGSTKTSQGYGKLSWDHGSTWGERFMFARFQNESFFDPRGGYSAPGQRQPIELPNGDLLLNGGHNWNTGASPTGTHMLHIPAGNYDNRHPEHGDWEYQLMTSDNYSWGAGYKPLTGGFLGFGTNKDTIEFIVRGGADEGHLSTWSYDGGNTWNSNLEPVNGGSRGVDVHNLDNGWCVLAAANGMYSRGLWVGVREGKTGSFEESVILEKPIGDWWGTADPSIEQSYHDRKVHITYSERDEEMIRSPVHVVLDPEKLCGLSPATTHTITTVAYGSGFVNPTGTITVLDGADYRITASPDSGKTISEVTVDGQAIGITNDYTFTNVQGDHTFSVTFSDGIVDSTPPSVPTGLAVTATTLDSISLSWNAAEDPESGVSTYNVYRGGMKIGTTTSTTYTDIGLAENTTYNYTVSAENLSGLESGQSSSLAATTDADTQPPSLVSVTAAMDTEVELHFSEPVDATDATDAGNYDIGGSITVQNAAFADDSTTVILTTSAMTGGANYTLTVSRIRDQSSNRNEAQDVTHDFTFYNELSVTDISPSGYETGELHNGSLMYTDRDYTYTAVGEYAGYTYIKTANDDANQSSDSFLSFTVNQPVTVRVAYDRRANTLPDWMSDWENTGDQIDVSDSYMNYMDVYAKSFAAGTITLGGNMASGASGAGGMYGVMLGRDSAPTSSPHSTVKRMRVGQGHRGPIRVYSLQGRLLGICETPAHLTTLPGMQHMVILVYTNGEKVLKHIQVR